MITRKMVFAQKRPIFYTSKIQRKRKLLNFVCSNSIWEDHTLYRDVSPTVLMYLHFDHDLAKRKAAGIVFPAGFAKSLLPTAISSKHHYLTKST